MDKYDIEGGWNWLKGKIKEEFADLTDDDILETEGKREQLIGKVQMRYNLSHEEAIQKVASMNVRFEDDDDDDDDDHHLHQAERAAKKMAHQIDHDNNAEAAKDFQDQQHAFAEKMQDEGTLDTSAETSAPPATNQMQHQPKPAAHGDHAQDQQQQ